MSQCKTRNKFGPFNQLKEQMEGIMLSTGGNQRAKSSNVGIKIIDMEDK
jgi:hypothetical protein